MSECYLFNCITHPLKKERIAGILLGNCIEHNPGDMVYAFSVMNVLTTSTDVELIPTGYYYYSGFSDRQIGELNEKCSKFILPLANMFCGDWCWMLGRYTHLIKSLHIPTVVPCVGVTGSQRGGMDRKCDAIVKDFINAVLDKSTCIGVRGDSTARYLRDLGYVEDRHFTVVGCPSLYTFGRNVKKFTPPTEFNRCGISMNVRAPADDWQLIDDFANLFRDKVFISQYYLEFYRWMLTNKKMYEGAFDTRYESVVDVYAQANRMRYFLDLNTWRECLSQCDFYIGHRIHGLIMALLSGTPGALIPFESRTTELASFHAIPQISGCHAQSRSKLRDVIQNLDFVPMIKRHKENFDHYLEFLHANGLKTVFDTNPDTSSFPLVEMMSKQHSHKLVLPYDSNCLSNKMQIDMALNVVRVKERIHRYAMAINRRMSLIKNCGVNHG